MEDAEGTTYYLAVDPVRKAPIILPPTDAKRKYKIYGENTKGCNYYNNRCHLNDDTISKIYYFAEKDSDKYMMVYANSLNDFNATFNYQRALEYFDEDKLYDIWLNLSEDFPELHSVKIIINNGEPLTNKYQYSFSLDINTIEVVMFIHSGKAGVLYDDIEMSGSGYDSKFAGGTFRGFNTYITNCQKYIIAIDLNPSMFSARNLIKHARDK